MKLILSLAAAACLAMGNTYAQDTEFCEAVTAVLHDAPNGFRNIRGRMYESNQNASMWAATVKIPGTLAVRIVNSMGQFYEAGLVQTTNSADLPPLYNVYKQKLRECLEPMGYKMSTQPNFIAGLSELKKLVFMQELKEGLSVNQLPPHVAMEVTYSKEVGKFTLVMFIFDH